MQQRANAPKKFIDLLRRRGIKDERVLAAMAKVPREQFVAREERSRAFSDLALPIACGQTISQPYMVAAMTEALEIAPGHKVLEIGTGSGYQAAVLAKLAKEIISIERHPALAESARERLKQLGVGNVTVIAADGMEGARDKAPFDRIIVTAAAPKLPPALLEQLAPGGVLVAPLGREGEVQTLNRLRKNAAGDVQTENLMAVLFVPLLPGLAS